MSRWHGPQYPGAARDMRAAKRAEAEARQRASRTPHQADGHKPVESHITLIQSMLTALKLALKDLGDFSNKVAKLFQNPPSKNDFTEET